MHLCQFVGDSVGNVGSGGGPAIGAEDDTVLEVDRHAMIQSEGVREMGERQSSCGILTSRFPG